MVVAFVPLGWCSHRRRAESNVPLMLFICASSCDQRHKQVVDTYGAWCAPVCRVTHAQRTRSTAWLKKRLSCVLFRLACSTIPTPFFLHQISRDPFTDLRLNFCILFTLNITVLLAFVQFRRYCVWGHVHIITGSKLTR